MYRRDACVRNVIVYLSVQDAVVPPPPPITRVPSCKSTRIDELIERVQTYDAAQINPSTRTQPRTRPAAEVQIEQTRLWDRRVDTGFPEAKVLKRRVRDVLVPGKGLGHSDR